MMMEGTIEKDCSAIGGLFQSIISDMRGSSPVWEDFASKATKLQSSLKTTLVAIGTFFRSLSESGRPRNRLQRCHQRDRYSSNTAMYEASEHRISILDNLVSPIQEKLEEWKKTVAHLDKEHAKEYKKARQEIKKAASDTVRLQKKAKKGKSDMQTRLDTAMQDVNDKYLLLEETEKNAVRTALIEERNRFCLFISCLKPFVDHEVSLLTEVTHLQEVMDCLCLQAADPHLLPSSSEQVIMDLKGLDNTVWNFQTPPSSPSSLGSRKSSMCSISSITSSSSGSTKSHSPSHHVRNNSLQLPSVGTLRLTSVSSQDSGFTSQDTLFHRPATPSSLSLQIKNSNSDCSTGTETPETDSTPSTPSENLSNTPSASSTWNNWPNQPVSKLEVSRPHTISSAYEKNYHTRPPLTAQLFEPPQTELSENRRPQTLDKSKPSGRQRTDSGHRANQSVQEDDSVQMRVMKHDRPHFSIATPYARPASINKMQPVLPPLGPKPKPKAVPPPKVPGIEPPIYANLSELAKMAAEKIHQDQDSEKTPTSKHPPSGPHPVSEMLDLEEAIRDLDSCTMALHSDYRPGLHSQQNEDKLQQNTTELADAIRELQASTAALQCSIDGESVTSQTSLQCSSGYGTMNSTPSGSEDTIPTGDFDFVPTELVSESEKYYTIPRNGDFSTTYRATLQQAIRPASTAGIPISQGGLGRRSSTNAPKPPPPVRRSSSISTAPPANLQKHRSSPSKQLNTQHMPPPGPPVVAPKHHRRSRSESHPAEPAYAELQTIQQSIQVRHEQERHYQHQHMASPYASSSMPLYASTSLQQAPQYSVAVVPTSNPNLIANQANLIQSLNSKFASLDSKPNKDNTTQKLHQGHCSTKPEEDFPLPPTEEELLEMERIYSTPTHTKDAVKASLISELKQGPMLRRVNNDSEC
ncbi:hypothetical protein ScPMuIL_000941 [Solemya velum]